MYFRDRHKVTHARTHARTHPRVMDRLLLPDVRDHQNGVTQAEVTVAHLTFVAEVGGHGRVESLK